MDFIALLCIASVNKKGGNALACTVVIYFYYSKTFCESLLDNKDWDRGFKNAIIVSMTVFYRDSSVESSRLPFYTYKYESENFGISVWLRHKDAAHYRS